MMTDLLLNPFFGGYALVGLIFARLLRNKIGIKKYEIDSPHKDDCNKSFTLSQVLPCDCSVSRIKASNLKDTRLVTDEKKVYRILGTIPAWPLYILVWLIFTEKLIPKSKQIPEDVVARLERANEEFKQELDELTADQIRRNRGV